MLPQIAGLCGMSDRSASPPWMVSPAEDSYAHPPKGPCGMIRLVCPHCHVPFLRVMPAEDGEEVVCPGCKQPFVPEEEEWVDPEDE